MPTVDFKIIDKLASEYGWTIEYIQKLDMHEITSFCKTIDDRTMENYRLLSYIAVLAQGGKTIDSCLKSTEQRIEERVNVEVVKQNIEETQKQERDMLKVFQIMGMSPSKAIDGVRKGKLEL